MDFLIRLIRPEDTEAVLASYRTAIRTCDVLHYYTPEIVAEWSDRTIIEFNQLNKSRQRFVADLQGTIIGYGGLDIERCALTECYVSHEYAGKGVGTALVERIELEARKAGLVSLQVLASLNAVAFYKRNGFEEQGVEYLLMDDGQRMRCMTLRKSLVGHLA